MKRVSVEDFHSNEDVYKEAVRDALGGGAVCFTKDGKPVGTMGTEAVGMISRLIKELAMAEQDSDAVQDLWSA